MSEIFDRINHLCKANNMAIGTLEKILGFGNGTIKAWDTAFPRLDKIKAVADFFEVAPSYLIDEFPVEMKEVYTVTAADKAILDAYRAADEKTRRAVRALLEVEE